MCERKAQYDLTKKSRDITQTSLSDSNAVSTQFKHPHDSSQ